MSPQSNFSSFFIEFNNFQKKLVRIQLLLFNYTYVFGRYIIFLNYNLTI